MDKKIDKNLSNVFYILTLVLTLGLFVLYVLRLFNVFKFAISVSYYTIFALLALCILINLTIILLEKAKKIYISAFIKLIIFISVLAYIGVFPVFGLYNKYVYVFLFELFSVMIFSIIGVSIFFNNMKTKDNIVKAKPTFVILFSFCFSVSSSVLLECIKDAVLIAFKKSVSVRMFIFSVLVSVALAIIYNCVFYISLKRNKRTINYCVIEKL